MEAECITTVADLVLWFRKVNIYTSKEGAGERRSSSW
jgi:hypothetical protein